MTEQTQAQEQAQPQEAGLTLQHIELAVRVIDLASARGAIRGEEMATVGALRNALTSFLQASGVGVEQAKEEASAEEQEQPAE